jgi:hypothetical protein
MPPHFLPYDDGGRSDRTVRWNGPVACSAANVGRSAADLKADMVELYRFSAKRDGCATESPFSGKYHDDLTANPVGLEKPRAIARHPPDGEHLGR